MEVAALSLGIGVGGAIGIIGAAIALGVRHGFDWDHLAAISDITSTTTAAGIEPAREAWLVREPGLMLTDESHHSLAASVVGGDAGPATMVRAAMPHAHSLGELGHRHDDRRPSGQLPAVGRFVRQQSLALLLGTMYALGHGSMVVVLGVLAIMAQEILPAWIDPIMSRIVGITLIALALYLFFSIAQFFRGGAEFRLRSRWMLVFAGIRNGYELLRSKLLGRPHEHVHEAQQYGVRTAYGVGLIHGIGAETGTQVLIIATAVGAGSRAMGLTALVAFVFGLLIANSIITIVSTAGFVSTQRRQGIYVAAGVVAALFSLFIGLFFLTDQGAALPEIERYLRWIGGPG